MKNTNKEFLKKYKELVLSTHEKVLGVTVIPKTSLDLIDGIIGSTLTAMNYANKEWTQTEIITDIGVKILFQHPFLDGNKRTAFALILTEAEAKKEKITEICNFLWDK